MAPLHDWACRCGEIFEARSASPDASPKCPRCGQVCSAVRLPSKPLNIIFRGSGFYITDSKGSRDQ